VECGRAQREGARAKVFRAMGEVGAREESQVAGGDGGEA
jgi:hypothetical protein